MKQKKLKICIEACTDPGIFVRGGGGVKGGPGPSVIKISGNVFFYFYLVVLHLFYRIPMV